MRLRSQARVTQKTNTEEGQSYSVDVLPSTDHQQDNYCLRICETHWGKILWWFSVKKKKRGGRGRDMS